MNRFRLSWFDLKDMRVYGIYADDLGAIKAVYAIMIQDTRINELLVTDLEKNETLKMKVRIG